MFVRKKKNRSGTVSVAIVSKLSGAYSEIRTVGTSSDVSEIAKMVAEGKEWVHRQNAIGDIFDNYERQEAERDKIEFFFKNIENILLDGTSQLLNRVYSMIGFDRIKDMVLKELVIARICQPRSKSATPDFVIASPKTALTL